MIVASFILVIGLTLLTIAVYQMREGEPAPAHPHDFTTSLNGGGVLKASIIFRYEEDDAEFLLYVPVMLSEFAIGLSNLEEGRELNRALEQALIESGLEDYEPRAIVTLKLLPKQEKRRSLAERTIDDLKAKDELASALAEATGIDLEKVAGASLKVHKQRFAEETIRDQFHHPDHV